MDVPGQLPLPDSKDLEWALPEGRFSGQTEFAEMIRLALRSAADQGWREIVVSDRSFEDWPLGERSVAESLNQWSRSGRKFVMLARSYEELVRRHARFVVWRRTWAHLIDCRSNSSLSAEEFPSALWSPVWVFQRMDLDRGTGIAGREPARRIALRERLDECLRRSSPAFPASTLGL